MDARIEITPTWQLALSGMSRAPRRARGLKFRRRQGHVPQAVSRPAGRVDRNHYNTSISRELMRRGRRPIWTVPPARFRFPYASGFPLNTGKMLNSP